MPKFPVLIAGAGPAGMLLAMQLARNGVRSMLIERNSTTTKWPKMDVTNCRSMELYRRLRIADGFREQGVNQDYSLNVLFSTGLSDGGELVSRWDLASPNEWRDRINSQNDGSMPREPYQRCSQSIFEAWLKEQIESEPLVSMHFGLRFESFQETQGGIESIAIAAEDGKKHTILSDYLVGCDGAGSKVRRCLGIEMIGGPTPAAMFLVHFKSRDLSKLHKQGQFWHIFFTTGAVIISQDEVDTWTVHLPISLDTDWKSLDPEKVIAQVLGGSGDPYPIKVDEVLVSSSWRPSIAVADCFASESLRVFLAGDSAHQNIPTGGYGMNTAVGDSFDLGWKLAAVINGGGGSHLLRSYEMERKPIAIQNIERSGVHLKVHQDYVGWVAEAGPGVILSQSTEAKELKEKIHRHVQEHPNENQDHGIEMGYRYNNSPIIVRSKDASKEPEWNHRNYFPSTWPGARAPHVFLSDGNTSIFDLFGQGFTLVDFTQDGKWAAQFAESAKRLGIQLKPVHLPQETTARKIWGRDAVLIRPDDFVAWRATEEGYEEDIESILNVAAGYKAADVGATMHIPKDIKTEGFTSTVGNVKQDGIKLTAAFQK
ncbi:phenol 2-monooxygenase [Fusarium tjaetaba]|uniref:Phenol 2-monooxygenase n=1 Tax=Fusarium tjaetaba TaxID=1567544 RepID=A0A8H5SHN2_9HYPO|nr:phenol 2-monooxygenase [Fusarium tjaetaba]KAF5650796.1 phenol 2-monooxygenase [Fusarium tjaetaba]